MSGISVFTEEARERALVPSATGGRREGAGHEPGRGLPQNTAKPAPGPWTSSLQNGGNGGKSISPLCKPPSPFVVAAETD